MPTYYEHERLYQQQQYHGNNLREYEYRSSTPEPPGLERYGSEDRPYSPMRPRSAYGHYERSSSPAPPISRPWSSLGTTRQDHYIHYM